MLCGRGRFIDDIALPRMLHAHFVRSPYAHAHIRGIEREDALHIEGAHAIFTLSDLSPHLTSERVPVHMESPGLRHRVEPYVLAAQEVCHVGEPIALVVADSRYVAEDVAERVAIEFEPLPVVSHPLAAIENGANRCRLDIPDNVVASMSIGYGDCDAALAGAAHLFRERFTIHKGGGHAMETRGIVARHDPIDRRTTAWITTQMPHRARDLLASALGVEPSEIRVVAPDVGGGFGPKLVFYPEEVAVVLAARLLGRPVKWIEDRREHFVATTQERDQVWDMEVGVDPSGRLQAIRGTLVHDHGAYTSYGTAVPFNSGTNLLGPYELPSYALDIIVAMTNRVPTSPTRGAGRPQGTFVMERLLDRVAGELGLDRVEVRRRNLIPVEKMPYVTSLRTRDGAAITYDSGDFAACQDLALKRIDYAGFERRREQAAESRERIGIGVANYVEGTGRGPYESAVVRIDPTGLVVIETGATAQGQGVKTMLAQLGSERLGLQPGDIRVVAGDTDAVSLGLGAFASRQAVTAGNAVHLAAGRVRDKALAAASAQLEVSQGDLELRDGRVHLVGAPDVGMSLAELATLLAGVPGFDLPAGLEPGLSASVHFDPGALTYCNGTHAAEVSVDPDTGGVRVLRYVVAHDCGHVINQTIVEGQIMGGVVHGIGNALLEEMLYDENGQPLSTNFGEYLLPTSPDLPDIEIVHMESPTPLNPLGVKGAGESGTIAAAACIASAIDDALGVTGRGVNRTPISPVRLFDLIASLDR